MRTKFTHFCTYLIRTHVAWPGHILCARRNGCYAVVHERDDAGDAIALHSGDDDDHGDDDADVDCDDGGARAMKYFIRNFYDVVDKFYCRQFLIYMVETTIKNFGV